MSNPVVFIGEEVHAESGQAKPIYISGGGPMLCGIHGGGPCPNSCGVLKSWKNEMNSKIGPKEVKQPPIHKVIYSNDGNKVIFSFSYGSHIIANGGYNILVGSDKNDYLYGRDGGDILIGGKGDDVLFGGDGNYTFIGGEGNNFLSGGRGTNTYIIDPDERSYHIIHRFTQEDRFVVGNCNFNHHNGISFLVFGDYENFEHKVLKKSYGLNPLLIEPSKEERRKGIIKVQIGKSTIAFENLSLQDGAVLWEQKSEKVEDLSPQTALFYKEVTRLSYQKAPNLLKVEKFKTDSVVAIKR